MSGEANLGEVLDKMLSGMKCKNHVVRIAEEYKLDCKKKRKLVQDSVIDYIMDRLDIVREQKLPEE